MSEVPGKQEVYFHDWSFFNWCPHATTIYNFYLEGKNVPNIRPKFWNFMCLRITLDSAFQSFFYTELIALLLFSNVVFNVPFVASVGVKYLTSKK